MEGRNRSGRDRARMVNFIEAQKPLLSRLMKMAGLRPIEVELEPGTTMHVWAPKHHVGKKGTTISPLDPAAAGGKKPAGGSRRRRRGPESRPNVVLIHGFAAEGNVTWQFNFGVLVSRYNLYIPDLMFFGKSSTASADRSPDFQAACVAGALARLGVARCDVVGFSYGGMVAFKLAEARPELVRSLCVSGSVVTMTDAVNRETMERLGAGSSAELLMPETLKGLKALLSISMYKKMWFPDRFYKDYLKVIFLFFFSDVRVGSGSTLSNSRTVLGQLRCKRLKGTVSMSRLQIKMIPTEPFFLQFSRQGSIDHYTVRVFYCLTSNIICMCWVASR